MKFHFTLNVSIIQIFKAPIRYPQWFVLKMAYPANQIIAILI